MAKKKNPSNKMIKPASVARDKNAQSFRIGSIFGGSGLVPPDNKGNGFVDCIGYCI